MTRRLLSLAVLVAALVLVQTSALAAPVPVSGIVADSTGAPVPNVHVVLLQRSRTLPEGQQLLVLARAVVDNQGRFSFGVIDTESHPRPMNADFMIIKTDLQYRVATDDGQERVVQRVDVTTDKKDDVVQSATLKITVR